ncbi:MAG: energy-coupling factor transporter transmembrane protein EcfT, partial [Vallitaleaceae bacterium]|nr:energy-coupling factor transporter transmembrane protein EcfT [Vallitaleaceae bacterium]
FGFPDQLSFSISFAYRILPLIMEEFQGILLSHRLRGVAPEKKGPFGMIKVLIYQIKMIILSFYPLMLNMAKRSRTTVEALELKGYQHSLKDHRVRKMKLARLKIQKSDVIFSAISLVYVMVAFLLDWSFI